MPQTSPMLQELKQRAEAGLALRDPEAIDVTPKEAWAVLHDDPDALLVDVRTAPEWAFVGVPSLGGLGRKVITLSWRSFPQFEVNSAFVDQLKPNIPANDTPVFLICRTGGRSLDAALALRAAGYETCFNVAGGFEGEPDSQQHRGTIGGWKAAGLPWEQN